MPLLKAPCCPMGTDTHVPVDKSRSSDSAPSPQAAIQTDCDPQGLTSITHAGPSRSDQLTQSYRCHWQWSFSGVGVSLKVSDKPGFSERWINSVRSSQTASEGTFLMVGMAPSQWSRVLRRPTVSWGDGSNTAPSNSKWISTQGRFFSVYMLGLPKPHCLWQLEPSYFHFS